MGKAATATGFTYGVVKGQEAAQQNDMLKAGLYFTSAGTGPAAFAAKLALAAAEKDLASGATVLATRYVPVALAKTALQTFGTARKSGEISRVAASEFEDASASRAGRIRPRSMLYSDPSLYALARRVPPVDAGEHWRAGADARRGLRDSYLV